MNRSVSGWRTCRVQRGNRMEILGDIKAKYPGYSRKQERGGVGDSGREERGHVPPVQGGARQVTFVTLYFHSTVCTICCNLYGVERHLSSFGCVTVGENRHGCV